MIASITRFAAAALTLTLACMAGAHAADYVQAPGSTLAFASSYDTETFSGHFGGLDTKLRFDPEHPETGRLEVAITLAGTTSGNEERDTTLLGENFFNIAKFGKATYTASKFRALGNNQFAADGTLNLRGISKPVTLTFTWTPGTRPVLSGRATVKRLDFGVGSGEWADTAAIPDAVAISTKVVFEQKK